MYLEPAICFIVFLLLWPFVGIIHCRRRRSFIVRHNHDSPPPHTGRVCCYPSPHPSLVRPRNRRQALSEEGCRNAPRLFLREASETDLIKVVKSLDKTNRVPGGRGDGTNASASYSGSPAWLVSRLTGGSGGGGGAEEEKGGEGEGRRGGVSSHALASALVYFLHRLPEPLLTFRRREAFLACEVGKVQRWFGFEMKYSHPWKD